MDRHLPQLACKGAVRDPVVAQPAMQGSFMGWTCDRFLVPPHTAPSRGATLWYKNKKIMQQGNLLRERYTPVAPVGALPRSSF